MEDILPSVFCAHTQMVDTASPVENPRNLNRHPENQIVSLAKIIKYQGWRNAIVVSKRSGFIVKGHGRLKAAQMLQLENVPVDYQDYDNEAVSYERNKNALIVKNMGDLITKYGEWGSIVCSEDRRVLLNSDYAVVSHQNRCGMLCYMLPREPEEEMMRYLGYEYVQYFYDALVVKSYNQLHCQMKRLAGKKSRKIASTLYENYVIPELRWTKPCYSDAKEVPPLRKDTLNEAEIHQYGFLSLFTGIIAIA